MTHHAPLNETDIEEAGLRLKLGDTNVLRRIFGLLGPPVRARLSRAFRPGLNEEDVEDVLATALARLWQNREHYDPGRGSLLTWFYLLARSVALDLLRHKSQQLHELRQFAEAARAPARQPPPVAGAEAPAPQSPRLRRLHELLQALRPEDRDILLAFAAGGGEGPWAAGIAEALGWSANAVRVRKKRLLDRLRDQLRDTPPADPERKERDAMTSRSEKSQDAQEAQQERESQVDAPPSPEGDPLRRLGGFRSELEEMAAHLHEACDRALRHGQDPRQQFARLWNACLEDGSLEDEQRLRILQRTWCWEEALLRSGEPFRDQVRRFARRCREDAPSAWLAQQPDPLLSDRLQRGIVGVGNALEGRMPRRVRRERTGEVRVKWLEEPRLDGRCSWVAAEQPNPLLLRPTADSSMRLFGELPAPESEHCADRLVQDLREGALQLPDFRRVKESLWVWRPEVVEPLPQAKAPAAGDRLKEEATRPAEVELQLWDRHPAVAAAVDDALCAAAAADYRQGSHGLWEVANTGGASALPADSAVGKVVAALQELTGRPTQEVVLLLTPLLERRLGQNCNEEACERYVQALEFLWSQLEGA